MLLSLRIENFALIDRLELEFGAGLHVLTGETGAGKSIILDAIDAVLGGKVSSRAVRTGTDRALVEASFTPDPGLATWLAEQDIPVAHGEPLICNREIGAGSGSARSRSRLNGVMVNKQQMEALRARLVEITAQGQTVQLGQPQVQRDWLDSYGGLALLQHRETVTAAYNAMQQAQQALEKRRRSEQQRLQQLDLFEYQFKELTAAHLEDPEELTLLEQERQRLSHSVELQQQSYEVYQALYENEDGKACADLLGKAQDTLTDMVRYDKQIEPLLEMITDALAQVEEAGRQINQYGEAVETDPERLQEVESRIIELKQICRKYGPTLGDAIAHWQSLQSQLDDLTGSGQSLEDLEAAYTERKAVLVTLCAQLTEMRRVAAQELEASLVAELKPLAMDKVQFQVSIAALQPTAYGADQITFLFSPNPGEPLQPLTEIASGGEMSRFLLALKACFSQVDPIGTLVFDEIDVGVSGRVAQAIAEKLHQLSLRHQVLCVTHQPIVAAMADLHFRVDKQVIGEKTATKGKGRGKKAQADEVAEDVRTVVRVNALDSDQRLEELAQIAGGKTDNEAIAFAESLITQAEKARQQQAIATAEIQKRRARGTPKKSK